MKKNLLKVILLSSILILLPLDLIIALADETYTVTIPDSYDISAAKTQDHVYAYKDGTISVSKVSLNPNQYLHISFNDSNTPAYNLTNDADSKYHIPFYLFSAFPNETAVTLGSKTLYPITPGSNFINIASDSVAPSDISTFDCYAGFDCFEIPAVGNYKGFITFTVSVDGSSQ